MLFSLKNSSGQPGLIGIEPPPDLDRLTPEILQKALQEHVKGSARKTGFEKALAVRQGVEKVFYGKDSITVRFMWTRPPDGKEASAESQSAAALRAALPAVPNDQKERGPGLLAESDPLLRRSTIKIVELDGIEPTTSCMPCRRSPN